MLKSKHSYSKRTANKNIKALGSCSEELLLALVDVMFKLAPDNNEYLKVLLFEHRIFFIDDFRYSCNLCCIAFEFFLLDVMVVSQISNILPVHGMVGPINIACLLGSV